MTGHFKIFPLLGTQVRGQGQLGHAQDPDHGRADFVGDVGQKMALGLVSRLGRFLGPGQFGLHSPAGRDIAQMDPEKRQSGRFEAFLAQDGLAAGFGHDHFHPVFGGQRDAERQARQLAGIAPKQDRGAWGGVQNDAGRVHQQQNISGEPGNGVRVAYESVEHD